MFGGPIITQKYEVHQNELFQKAKFKNFLPRGAAWECFPQALLWLSMSLSKVNIETVYKTGQKYLIFENSFLQEYHQTRLCIEN